MPKVIYKDSHTNANGCSLIEYQFESVEDLIKFEKYKIESLKASIESMLLTEEDLALYDKEYSVTEDPLVQPIIVDINVAKKPKETKH